MHQRQTPLLLQLPMRRLLRRLPQLQMQPQLQKQRLQLLKQRPQHLMQLLLLLQTVLLLLLPHLALLALVSVAKLNPLVAVLVL